MEEDNGRLAPGRVCVSVVCNVSPFSHDLSSPRSVPLKFKKVTARLQRDVLRCVSPSSLSVCLAERGEEKGRKI